MKLKNNWQLKEVNKLFEQPFNDLLSQAHEIHRKNFSPNEVQLSTLLSIKTGTCPEDCSYCSQSGHNKTDLQKEKLLDVDFVIERAKKAKSKGATRFCMAGAWRSPPKKDMPAVIEMIRQVKAMGMETCLAAGSLDEQQAQDLKEAGLDYYNHNIDTSEEHYKKIITTRTYQDRFDTLNIVRDIGINVCCGGIVGLGESKQDRIKFIMTLANMQQHPPSVPINRLVRIKGTPLHHEEPLGDIDFVKVIALARVMMPKSVIRLSAGRESMPEVMQAMCFFAGANSIYYGEKLLTVKNAEATQDTALFEKLGISATQSELCNV